MPVRHFLFIDGTNLYAGQRELLGPNRYLFFPTLIKQIEQKLKISFSQIYFYASYSPESKKLTAKIKQYLKNEFLFYQSVKETKKVIFFKGYRSKTSGKEKEVDVKMAVDIVDFAHRKKYDYLYLFSGDADFMHALKAAERLSKKIYILALENRLPHRFSFTYPTTVFKFSPRKFNKHPKQKIKFIVVNKNKVVKVVK